MVESTKIDNTSFPYKTAIPEANVKTNRIVSTKWTSSQRTELVTLYFLENFVSVLRNSYKELVWCSNEPNAHIRTFCKRWSFI